MKNIYKITIGAFIGVLVSYIFMLTVKPLENKLSIISETYKNVSKNKKDNEKEALTRSITDSIHFSMIKCLKSDVIMLTEAKFEYQNTIDQYLAESRRSDELMKAEFKGMKEAFQMMSVAMAQCIGNDSTAYNIATSEQ